MGFEDDDAGTGGAALGDLLARRWQGGERWRLVFGVLSYERRWLRLRPVSVQTERGREGHHLTLI